MICRCPGCGAALKYDPKSAKMVCNYCKNSFEPSEVKKKEEMECNIYTCSACGAELMVNGLETSTYCSYCGQPTVIFSRTSRELQPDLVIPFSVTKDEAITNIRNSMKNSIFIPKGIKHFDIERIRGIYMPFWVCDVDHEGKAIINSKHDDKSWWHHYRYGKCNFKNMTADASERLNDESSQRLEPYDLSEAVPFEQSYLSGFYADRYDVSEEDVEKVIKTRAKEYYDEEMLKSVPGSAQEILEESADTNIINAYYTMLPVWFLTFLYKDNPYTFLVNGQTGKVVGGVPYNKILTRILIAILTLIFLIPCFYLCDFLISEEYSIKAILSILILSAGMWINGKTSIEKVEKANELTTSTVVRDMVKDREEEH